MRIFLVSLTLLFASVAVVAQDQPTGQASAPELAPAFQKNWASTGQAPLTFHVVDPRVFEQWRANNAPCYTMRSYLFDRRDNFAPELVRMTTCTPARDFQLKRTEKPPTGRLVPLTSPADNIQK